MLKKTALKRIVRSAFPGHHMLGSVTAGGVHSTSARFAYILPVVSVVWQENPTLTPELRPHWKVVYGPVVA